MNITIDARECGAGKTHGPKGTLARITNIRMVDEKVIISLPSIDLAKDYQKQFPEARVINSSEITGKVVESVINSMILGVEVIIITHQALLMAEIPTALKMEYNLVIDEAFDPWKCVEINREDTDNLIQWDKFIDIIEMTDGSYMKVRLGNLSTNEIYASHHKIRSLQSSNYDTYIHVDFVEVDSHNNLKLNQKALDTVKMAFFQELRHDFFSGFQSLHVAAAYFTDTLLSHWMNYAKMKFNVVEKPEKHDKSVVFHIPDYEQIHKYHTRSDGKTPKFEWSKNKRTGSMKFFLDQYHEYLFQQVGTDYLFLRNLDCDESLGLDEYRLKHNSAGSNDYAHMRNVSLESTLNPSKWFYSFLNTRCSNSDDVLLAGHSVYVAITGYTYYQSLMRSYLRVDDWDSNDRVNIFLIDERAWLYLSGLFSNFEVVEYSITYPDTWGKKKKTALTGPQRRQATYLRKKYPEDKELDARAILIKYKKM